ncbi:MAG: hypothetical protein NC434_09275 [Ruminococcus sp.]|nr:hypothetical protein [Ruminococcus sp.]
MTVQIFAEGKQGTLVHQNENALARKAVRQNQKNEQLKNGSINMNELNGKMDSILMRRQRAQKKAMKVVGDAWNADKKIDADIGNRRNHIEELQSSIDENMAIIADGEAHKEELRKTYGVAADSQEQKDLELMEKWQRSLTLDSQVTLTDEEQARIEELSAGTRTEYQERAMKIDSGMGIYESRIKESQKEMRAEYSAIRAIKQERLKDHTMVDAQKEAEDIVEDANKEIIGMLIGEAKDHVDEEQAEKIEEAKEKAEEKEEQEEKLEEQRAEKEEQRAQLEIEQAESRETEEVKAEQRKRARQQADLLGEMQENIVSPSSNAAEAQQAIKEMLQKMKLLEEDLKGANVDVKLDDERCNFDVAKGNLPLY